VLVLGPHRSRFVWGVTSVGESPDGPSLRSELTITGIAATVVPCSSRLLTTACRDTTRYWILQVTDFLKYYRQDNRQIGRMVALHCLVCGLADPGGLVVEAVGLQQLAGRGCGFASRREHECLSPVSVVCCQVEVCARSTVVLPTVVCPSMIRCNNNPLHLQ
jgi:hypothetical protein